jgi:hypothetical protein
MKTLDFGSGGGLGGLTNNFVFRIVKNIMFFIMKFKIELKDKKYVH